MYYERIMYSIFLFSHLEEIEIVYTHVTQMTQEV
jgi:hypothetical protein